MGNVLAIQCRESDRIKDILARALAVFETVCGLQPLQELVSEFGAIVKFPRLLGLSTGIVHNENSQSWACGIGTWFYDGATGEEALTTLGRRALHEETDLGAALSHLDGHFAVLAGDAGTMEFSVVTDRVGTLHVYAARLGSALLLSSSSLVLATLINPEWDEYGCREFLATGTIFENRTLFRGIEKLQPATVSRFRDGCLVSEQKYWQLDKVAQDVSSASRSVQQLAEALQRGLAKVAGAFPNPVVDLTGGLDSRALLGAMLDLGVEFETVVNGTPDHPDVIAANRIAGEYNLKHRHQPLPPQWEQQRWERAKASLPLCDGEYDILEYARIFENHRRLAGQFDVSINGSGGEFCKGYWWELLFPFVGRVGRFDESRVAAKRFAVDLWSSDLMSREFTEDLREHFASVIRRANAGLMHLPNTALMDNVYLSLRMQRWQGRIASATNRIWPCVSPFMFKSALGVALSAPPADRARNRLSRRLIEHFDPRLASLPLAQGYPASPMRTANLHRFWPLGVEVSKKVWRRFCAALPSRVRAESRDTPEPVCGLLSLEEIRDLLHVESMLTGNLYNLGKLENLVGSTSRAPGVDESHLGRIITLEFLARTIRAGRSESERTTTNP